MGYLEDYFMFGLFKKEPKYLNSIWNICRGDKQFPDWSVLDFKEQYDNRYTRIIEVSKFILDTCTLNINSKEPIYKDSKVLLVSKDEKTKSEDSDIIDYVTKELYGVTIDNKLFLHTTPEKLESKLHTLKGQSYKDMAVIVIGDESTKLEDIDSKVKSHTIPIISNVKGRLLRFLII